MSKRQARMGVGGAIVRLILCCVVLCFVVVVRGSVGGGGGGGGGGGVGGGVCYDQVSQYNISSNLESKHFSATSGGLYSLVGGSGVGGGGDSTVHEMVLVNSMFW